MSKTKFKTINGITIYPIDYLINNELSDNDLSNLLDNNKRGLQFSLILGMFEFIKCNKGNSNIIKIIKSDKKWFNKFHWTKKQCMDYENLLVGVYKNVYQYNDIKSLSLTQWFISIYGLNVNGNTVDL